MGEKPEGFSTDAMRMPKLAQQGRPDETKKSVKDDLRRVPTGTDKQRHRRKFRFDVAVIEIWGFGPS
jgi:hypothetical protein